MTSNDQYVLELLTEAGVVTPDQTQQAQAAGLGEGESMVDALVRQGIVTEETVLGVVASQLGMEMVSLDGFDLTPELRDSIPQDQAQRYQVVPVYRTEQGLTVAMSDPLALDTLDSLRFVLKCHVDGVVAVRSEITALLTKNYSMDYSVEDMLNQMKDGIVDVTSPGTDNLMDGNPGDTDAPIIKLASAIIYEAYRNRATDIHMEPLEKRFRVRYRIDGVMQEVEGPPKRLQSAVINRVKIMANMNLSEKRIPQDGRIPIHIGGKQLDLRVSTVPCVHGESIVMRILDKENLSMGLENLGFFPDDRQSLERVITMADGIMLVTGPTGSGKSTTLYSCLSEINKPDKKIITVEDPVEYQLTGINQVMVREDIGLGFGTALRAILRQSPNVVMVGEIRDGETANIATEASLTGHLVFSTLHTNDAPGAVTRLLDIGVKPFLVASALRTVLAQRLIRRICVECKEPYTPRPEELISLGPHAKALEGVQLFKGRGCNTCNLTGYKGRRGIFEIFNVTDEMRQMIFERVSSNRLREVARRNGMRSLREDGVRKIVSGMTSIEEVVSITMGDLN